MQLGLPFDCAGSRPAPAGPGHSSFEPAARPQPPATRDWEPALEFIRHPRARRYVMRLTEQGGVRVTIPRWGSKREARAFAARERDWIERQRARIQTERERPSPPPLAPDRERELRERARRELPARLRELADRHGFPAGAVAKISVRDQKWRWGSCSPGGHICLNWRLASLPDAVRDYVLIHELMHLKRMDHSPRFWKLVAQACPEYRELRKFLRSVPR